MEQPRAGTHYPRSTGEFQAWFRTDADCLDYLEWLRWPGGFTCPSCGPAAGWRLGDGRYECAACHGRASVTAGTIFDRTRTPLTVWVHGVLAVRHPVGFQNSAAGPDLGFYAARSYSLMRPPRTGRRLICLRERSATGWSGRGGRSWRLR